MLGIFEIGQIVNVRGFGDRPFFVTQACGDYCVVESNANLTLVKCVDDVFYNLQDVSTVNVSLMNLLVDKIKKVCEEEHISAHMVLPKFLTANDDINFEDWQQVVLAEFIISLVHKDRKVESLRVKYGD